LSRSYIKVAVCVEASNLGMFSVESVLLVAYQWLN